MFILLSFYRCTTRNIWDLWWLGNPRERYAPYRQIDQVDLANKKDHSYLSKAKFVIEKLVEVCPGALSTAQLSKKNASELDEVFATVYGLMCELLYPSKTVEMLDRKRIGDRSYVTVYDHMKQCGLK